MIQRLITFFKRHFGPREWIALLGSVLLLIIAVWLASYSGRLESFGYFGGFLAMLIGSATVILPAPGLAVVAALGATLPNFFLLGLVAGLGATLGEITGYLAGYSGHKIMEDRKHYAQVEHYIERYGFLTIVVLAFIPNPLFDVAGIVAGSAKYPLLRFLSATLIGKIAKCTLVAYAGALSFGWFL